jgi:hypothetical protein
VKVFTVHASGRYALGLYVVAARDVADAEQFVSAHIGLCRHNPLRFHAGKAECVGSTKKPRGILDKVEYIE